MDFIKKHILIIVCIAAGILLGVLGFIIWSQHSTINEQQVETQKLQQEQKDMQDLLEMGKLNLEEQYEQFSREYSEYSRTITNDSLVAQLTREQMRYQKLLEELKQTKATDAREITRLRKELETVRGVLRDYIRQVDSLNQVNRTLVTENTEIKGRLEESHRVNLDLQEEKEKLTEKVTIAAQLDATNIGMSILKKRNKVTKKIKDCKTIQVNFNISRNVTAANGQRALYVRIQTPSGEVLNGGGSFPYENRQLEYSMKKLVEYTGEEVAVVTYWTVSEYLSAGEYRVSIFADGNMIGTRTFTFK